MVVDPIDVRLLPTPEDPYEWKVLPEKKHLFAKHMSKHSKGAYQELIREAGISFEAVRRDPDKNGHTGTAVTFSETIDRLATDNIRLSADLEAANSRCESLESDLARIQVELETMTRRKEEVTALVVRYKDITMKTLRESYRAFEDFLPSDLLDGQTARAA
jgi:predicted RNase H-like nuclease (RuvC/YqgF family)